MPGFMITGQETSGANSKAEFHRSHRWSITDIGLPAAVGGGATADRSSLMFAKSLKLPTMQFEEELVLGGSSYYSFAKAAAWQNAEITFYDVYGLFALLESWQHLMWNPADGMNVADAYKGVPKFDLLDNGGKSVLNFSMTGAYPKTITHGELSYTASDIKSVTITYSYDFATIIANGG